MGRIEVGWPMADLFPMVASIRHQICVDNATRKLWLAGRVEREKRPGVNDLGKIKNLMHFKAK